MKTIVIYYSNKGSNKYLAEKIATNLGCEIEEIKPRLNVFLLFLMSVNMGIRPLKNNIQDYERIILCGPIWMGKLIPPLRSFINKYKNEIGKLIFVSCCGSPFSKKDDKFGHALVFMEVKKILDAKCIFCQAFPIELVLPDDKKEDPDATMKTRLNDTNFKGEIQELYKGFMKRVSEAKR